MMSSMNNASQGELTKPSPDISQAERDPVFEKVDADLRQAVAEVNRLAAEAKAKGIPLHQLIPVP